MKRKIRELRAEVFARPGIREISSGKKPVYLDRFEDIIPFHEQRKADEYEVISPDVYIIPKYSGFYSAVNFGKRGNLVLLNTFQGCNNREVQEKRLMTEKFSFIKARIAAQERYAFNASQRYVGWVWFDPRETAHVVHPSGAIEGVRLYMDGVKSGSIEDWTTAEKQDKAYHAIDTHQRDVAVAVPSRSGDKKDTVILEHQTDPEDLRMHFESTYFDARHMCDLRKWAGVTFGFQHQVVYCPHIACAQFKRTIDVARSKPRNVKRIIDQPIPTFFSEPTLRLYLSLIYNTVKADAENDGKNVTFPRRTLATSEIDAVLMSAYLLHSNKKTFWRGAPTKGYKPMSQYNWENNAPGIPFSKFREGA